MAQHLGLPSRSTTPPSPPLTPSNLTCRTPCHMGSQAQTHPLAPTTPISTYPRLDTSFLPAPTPQCCCLLELQMHRIPGPATFSAVPPAPTHGGFTHPGRLYCPFSISQHCLSQRGDLEPPHWAKHGGSALPHTHILTHVTLGWSLSLSGPVSTSVKWHSP